MRRPTLLVLLSLIGFLGTPLAIRANDGLASRWWEPVSEAEAKSPGVLGLWRFDSETEVGRDDSAQGNPGKLAGAKWHAEGRFGGALESFAGHPVIDERHAFLVPRAPVLSPSGAFTLEMWLRPKPESEFLPELRPVLADTKYTRDTHQGFQWVLSPADRQGQRRFSVEIGLGHRSAMWHSDSFQLQPEHWHHAAFSYDGAGEVVFWLDGTEIGRSRVPSAAGLAAASRELSIGDRLGSNFHGFPGWIDEVRLSEGVRHFRPLQVLSQATRPAFRRFDEKAVLRADVLNLTNSALQALEIVIELPSASPSRLKLEALAPGASHLLEIPLDTSLRPGNYEAVVTVSTPGWGGEGLVHETRIKLPYVLVPRPKPHRMPVVLWGLGGTESVRQELHRVKDLGFTHCLGLGLDYAAVWEQGAAAPVGKPEALRDGRDLLDTALAHDLGIIASVSPGQWLKKTKAGAPYLRVDRQGKPYPDGDISGLFPRVQQFFHEAGAALGRAYGDHPAFAAVLASTEVRDHSQLSFHPLEIEAARQALGGEIPEAATLKNGVDYTKLPDFPKDRVLRDEDPLLAFYRWFWTEGDGWNQLHTQLHEGLRKRIPRKDFWTFFDPAVRVPSIAGSGGSVDVLSHWTYTYPDPVRIGLCTDELFAMARANGRGQQVMKMTQIIWYRSQTAPANAQLPVEGSPWVDQDPNAAYITIAPMHLREALWLKLARPVTGIMYHGWGSLVPVDPPTSYVFTNPNAAPELKRLVSEVVEPLGPTLLQVPDPAAEVLFLESFTSQMFARRGTYGWGRGWAADLYQVAVRAQLQPKVVYEEGLSGELKEAKVLIMGDCDVLPASVVAAVQAFQKAGGLVIGDEELCPAIQPSLKVPRYRRTRHAKEDFAALAALSDQLQKDLRAAGYRWPLASENPDVLTRRRVAGTSDYLFAINDRREAGSYVGRYGMVMEDGLPSVTQLRLQREGDAHVYDLLARRELPATREEDGRLAIPLSLGPCEGRLLLVSERPVEQLRLEIPAEADLGSSVEIALSVTDSQGQAVDAVVPIDLHIVDPEGAAAEPSGNYGAAGGRLQVTLDLARNDRPGLWEIRAIEGATGRESRAYLRVPPATPPSTEQAEKAAE